MGLPEGVGACLCYHHSLAVRSRGRCWAERIVIDVNALIHNVSLTVDMLSVVNKIGSI